MRRPSLDRLVAVAGAMRDRDLAALRAAGKAREETRALISAIDPAAAASDDDPAAQVNALRYRLWAEGRRRDLNIALARQTADWLNCRAAAAQSFGKAAVLEAMRAKPPLRRD